MPTRSAMRRAALLALFVSPAALALDVSRSDDGSGLAVSGFYKTLGSGVWLQPSSVQSARQLSTLLEQAAADAPPGVVIPAAPDVPAFGFVNAHLVRLAAKAQYQDWLEVEAAWQLNLTIASSPLFLQAQAVSGTVSGTSAVGAQRRLVDFNGPLAVTSALRLDHNLDRLFIKVPLPFGDLTIGRQVLSWGTGRIWNPTDVLSPFPPTAVDREVRRGFDAVRLAVALGDTTQLDLLYLPQLHAEDSGGIARFQTNVLGFDGSLSVGKYVNDLVIGADLVGDIGPVGVHAEGAYTIELNGLRTHDVSIGEHFFRGVVGAELRPHEKLLLLAEYSYNGYGTTDPARYAAVLSSARVVRGEIFGAGQHQAALAVTFLANDVLTASLSVLGNLTDPSAMVIPSVEWSFAQHFLLRAGGYVPIGRSPDANAYAGLTSSDVLSGSSAFTAANASRGIRSEYGSASFGAFLLLGAYLP